MAGAADIPAFRSMRTLRALRPLRAVSRWEGMRVSSSTKIDRVANIENVNVLCSDAILQLFLIIQQFLKKTAMNIKTSNLFFPLN